MLVFHGVRNTKQMARKDVGRVSCTDIQSGEGYEFISGGGSPENRGRWANAGLMLAQRLRRWTSIKPALVQRPAFAGIETIVYLTLPITVFITSASLNTNQKVLLRLICVLLFRITIYAQALIKWKSVSSQPALPIIHWSMLIGIYRICLRDRFFFVGNELLIQ